MLLVPSVTDGERGLGLTRDQSLELLRRRGAAGRILRIAGRAEQEPQRTAARGEGDRLCLRRREPEDCRRARRGSPHDEDVGEQQAERVSTRPGDLVVDVDAIAARDVADEALGAADRDGHGALEARELAWAARRSARRSGQPS